MARELEYIDAQARDIVNYWVQPFETDGTDLFTIAAEEGLGDAEIFIETFQANIEAAVIGAPMDIFPDPLRDTDNAVMLNLMRNLIAARVYQLLFAYDITDD